MQADIAHGNTHQKDRAIGLDLLRISMAMLVFMFHSRIHVLKCNYGLLNNLVDMGSIAMTGFFLLSGYVINLSYYKANMSCFKEIKTFYLKRLISIVPLYFVWSLFQVVLNIIINGKAAAFQEAILFPVEFLGIQSTYSSLLSYSHNNSSWFISCIIICYFLYPLIQILTKDLSERAKALVIAALCCILLWSPIIQHYFNLQTIYSNPFIRSLEFAVGILLSQMNNTDTPCKLITTLRKPFVCVLSLICLVVGASVFRIVTAPDSWLVLPCFMSLLVSLGYIKFEKLQNSKIIHYLSEISFCIYISQTVYLWYFLKHIIDMIGYDSDYFKIILSLSACFVIANILHFLIEIPSSKYLKRKLLAK